MFAKKINRWIFVSVIILFFYGCNAVSSFEETAASRAFPEPGQRVFVTEEATETRLNPSDEADHVSSQVAESEQISTLVPEASASKAKIAGEQRLYGKTHDQVETSFTKKFQVKKGQFLYFLHEYKGLLVFDLQDPNRPVQIGRYPFSGSPVAIFQEDHYLYVVLNDVVSFSAQQTPSLSFPQRYSEILLFDLSNPMKTTLLQRLRFSEHIRQESVVKLKERLFFLTEDSELSSSTEDLKHQERESSVWLSSVHLDPLKSLRLQKIFALSNTFSHSSFTHMTRTSILFSLRPQGILLSEVWRLRKYSKSQRPCKIEEERVETRVTYFQRDIGDTFSLKKVMERTVKGRLLSRTRQQIVSNHFVGVFQSEEWDESICKSQLIQSTQIVSFSLFDRQDQMNTALPITSKGQEIYATKFDSFRSLFFLNIGNQSDRGMVVIDVSSPKKPLFQKMLKNIGVRGSFVRFLRGNRYLMIVGEDDLNCSEKTTQHKSVGWSIQTIDIQDPISSKRVSLDCFEQRESYPGRFVTDWKSSNTAESITFYQDNDRLSLTVPFVFHPLNPKNPESLEKKSVFTFAWSGQLNALKRDEPDWLQQNGTFLHRQGSLDRSFLMTNIGLSSQENGTFLLFHVSLTHWTIGIVSSMPQVLFSAELASFSKSLFRFGNYLVEEVQLGEGKGDREFRIRDIDNVLLSRSSLVASFRQKNIQNVLKVGFYLVLMKTLLEPSGADQTEIVLVDFRVPRKPRILKPMRLPFALDVSKDFSCEACSQPIPFHNGIDVGKRWLSIEKGIVFLTNSLKTSQALAFLDFSDEHRPRYRQINLPFGALSLVPFSSKRFFLVMREKVNERQDDGIVYSTYRYSAQPWIFTGRSWKGNAKINLPGRLVQVFQQGEQTQLITYEKIWPLKKDDWVRIHLLTLSPYGDIASSSDSFEEKGLTSLLLDGQRLYLTHKRSGENGSDVRIYALAKNTFDLQMNLKNDVEDVRVMGSFRQKVFFSIGQKGYLLKDLRDLSASKSLHFLPADNSKMHISFIGDKLYSVSGYFDMSELSLEEPSISFE